MGNRNSTPTWDLEQYLALLHSFSQLSESREADERALLGHQSERSHLIVELSYSIQTGDRRGKYKKEFSMSHRKWALHHRFIL